MASVKSGQTHPRSVPDSSDGLVTKKPKIEGVLSIVAVLQGVISTSQMIYHRGGEPERALHC